MDKRSEFVFMSTNVNIFSGVIKYSVSTWINFILGILSVIITTRLLTPSIYGQISIFISISSVLMYVFTCGTDSALIRFYNEPPQNNTINQVIYKCLILISFGVIICILICSFIGKDISFLFFKSKSTTLCVALILQAWCSVVMRYLNISYRMSFRVKKYTIQNVLLNCVSRISIIIGAILFDNFILIVLLSTVVFILLTFTYLIIQANNIIPYSYENSNQIDFSLDLKGFKPYMRYSLLSAPTYIIVNFNGYINQQIILGLLGTYALGIFSSTSMFGQILLVMKGGFGTFWSAFVYKYYQTEHEKIKKMSDYIMILSIIALSVIVVARDLIYIFIGSDFHSSKSFFSLLLLYPILNFILEATGKGIDLKKKNEITLWAYVISILINIAMTYLLVPAMGLRGGAISNALSGLVLYSIITYYSQKFYVSIQSIRKNIGGIVFCIIITIIPFLTTKMMIIIPLILIVNIISFVVFRIEYITLYRYVVMKLCRRV